MCAGLQGEMSWSVLICDIQTMVTILTCVLLDTSVLNCSLIKHF